MAKKQSTVTELYAVLDSREVLTTWESTLERAKDYISGNEMSGAKIFKVTQIWEAQYPEEPEIEFYETSLEEV